MYTIHHTKFTWPNFFFLIPASLSDQHTSGHHLDDDDDQRETKKQNKKLKGKVCCWTNHMSDQFNSLRSYVRLDIGRSIGRSRLKEEEENNRNTIVGHCSFGHWWIIGVKSKSFFVVVSSSSQSIIIMYYDFWLFG